MNKSFYHFLGTKRHLAKPNELSKLAESVYADISFPKQSTDFHEISQYLELNGDYVRSMQTFDEAWALYLAENNHTN